MEKTALAEAEVEYEDHVSDTIFAAFPVSHSNAAVLQSPNTKIVIWTTTPWTIPGNRAIAYSSRYSYQLLVPCPAGRAAANSRASDLTSEEREVAARGHYSTSEWLDLVNAIELDKQRFHEKFGDSRFVISANPTLDADFRRQLAIFFE